MTTVMIPVPNAVSEESMQTFSEQSKEMGNGVFNISDGIIVHGRDAREHDTNLKALLERSRGKNVTFNRAKCDFSKDRVVYYGLMFSKDGVSRDSSKAQAIKSTGCPRNAAELNSFLCTVR